MQRTIDLDQVRVVQADNYRGNSRAAVACSNKRPPFRPDENPGT